MRTEDEIRAELEVLNKERAQRERYLIDASRHNNDTAWLVNRIFESTVSIEVLEWVLGKDEE